MKTKIILSTLALALIVGVFGQNPSVELTFTAVDQEAYIRLDSIKVMNRTHGDSVKLYWPDTTLMYQITPGDLLLYVGYATDYPVGMGHESNKEKEFRLFQSIPNPVNDKAIISLFLPSKGSLNLMVSDVRGRIAAKVDRVLDKGTHAFRFIAGDERIYLLTARWNGIKKSLKILTEGPPGGKTCKLEYAGPDQEKPSLKHAQVKAGFLVQESGILDTPDDDTTYTFQFATNIPCPGTPTVVYEGQVYNTIQIFSQCWIKENLNVGTMIPGGNYQSNNGIMEKYCYSNNSDSCTKYGGLYQWDEMMQHATQQGIRGICPPGWHLPTDEEWKVLEGAVDSQYGIGDPFWDHYQDYRGYDAGMNLKTVSGWRTNGNGVDLFGFSGLPGGSLYGISDFMDIGFSGFWWTSTQYGSNISWYRVINFDSPKITRYFFNKLSAFSVRCIRDY